MILQCHYLLPVDPQGEPGEAAPVFPAFGRLSVWYAICGRLIHVIAISGPGLSYRLSGVLSVFQMANPTEAG